MALTLARSRLTAAVGSRVVAAVPALRGLAAPTWRRCSPLAVRRGLATTMNWAENVTFRTSKEPVMPEDVADIQAAVKGARHVRVIGSTHSFTPIADTDDTLVSSAFLRDPPELDIDAMTVTVNGGTTYGQLCRFLAPRGAAVENLPSLPHVSIAGSIATGTHGSGTSLGNMGAQIAAMDIVTADGSVVTLSRKDTPEELETAMVGLGCFGVISSLTLDIVEAYDVTQVTYGSVPLDTYLDQLHHLNDEFDSVSAFIDFKNRNLECLWLRTFIFPEDREEGPFVIAAALRTDLCEVLEGAGASKLTEPVIFFESNAPVTTSARGPWQEMLFFFMKDLQDVGMPNLCLQAEFFVPLTDAVGALEAVGQVADKWPGWGEWDEKDASTAGPVIMSEIRFMRGDNYPLSPSRDRDSMSIHFTFNADSEAVLPLVTEYQDALAKFGARPHWGKLFTMDLERLRTVYADAGSVEAGNPTFEQVERFERLRAKLDPEGKFESDFTRAFVPRP